MDELPDDIYEKVTDLSELGNEELESDHPDKAIAIWKQALRELPSPQLKWEAAMWLHASIGDAYREAGDIEESYSHFLSAAAAEGGAQNAFVQYGLGISLYDLGRPDDATDPLLRAYMLAGTDIFEDDDPAYLKHLSDKNLIVS